MPTIPFIKISGSPEQIGHQYGEACRERIIETYDFYQQYFYDINQSSCDLEPYGEYYLNQIKLFNINYYHEIKGIAAASNLASWQLAVLNARTEIKQTLELNLTNKDINECTLLFFPQTAILGQNWDWRPELESLIVLLEIERDDGHKILMLTEPGIIGKIGFNQHGLGVGLNFLDSPQPVGGVPTHILLRSVLDSENIHQAYTTLKQADKKTSANFLIADADGEYLELELLQNQLLQPNYPNNIPIHTNHYLSQAIDNRLLTQHSRARFDRASELVDACDSYDIESMRAILLDKHNVNQPICRQYTIVNNSLIGTVCTLLMDLKNRSMQISDGSPLNHDFLTYQL